MLDCSKHVNRKVVAIITWSPWNPVARKNVEPCLECAIVNEASAYSYACRIVK
jgi:hypothetical protein